LSRATRIGGSSWPAVTPGNTSDSAQAMNESRKYEVLLDFVSRIFTDSSYSLESLQSNVRGRSYSVIGFLHFESARLGAHWDS